jgi:manganese/zinc/iron transport system substrate-binding protein
MRIVVIRSLLVLGCFVLSARTTAGAAALDDLAGRPIGALATTGIVADVVRNVGGERVQVNQLMSDGVDPHLYKPSELNVIALAEADVVFYSGPHLEAQMGKVFE